MPLMHCMKCEHEWEDSRENSLCDWCGEAGYVLDKETPLERMLKDENRARQIAGRVDRYKRSLKEKFDSLTPAEQTAIHLRYGDDLFAWGLEEKPI